MLANYPKFMLCMLIVLCIIIGWTSRGIVKGNDTIMSKSMAWGYDETDNMWNRIRVDKDGHVICNLVQIK